jgi:hypothetical protein
MLQSKSNKGRMFYTGESSICLYCVSNKKKETVFGLDDLHTHQGKRESGDTYMLLILFDLHCLLVVASN